MDDVTDWLHRHTHVLRTLDPSDGDLSDLEPLRDVVGDARVVGLGESGHYIHECLQLRHRVTRFLVTELGFTAVALETGFADALVVDAWLRGGSGDVADVARTGINYGFGVCAETVELLGLLKQHNETHDPGVSFYGLDLPGGCGTAEPAIEHGLRFLEGVEPATATWFRDRFAPLLAAWRREDHFAAIGGWLQLQQEDKDALLLLTTDLAGRLAAGQVPYGLASTPEEAELALRAAVNARQGVYNLYSSYRAGVPGPEVGSRHVNPRDAAVWENLQWVLQHHERVVLLYANGHIQRTGFAGGVIHSTLGEHVTAAGLSYVAIGTTIGSGEILNMAPEGVTMDVTAPTAAVASVAALDGSFDAALRLGPDAPYLLDLRDVTDGAPPALRAAATMMTSNIALPTDVLGGFDAVVHLPDVSLARIDPDYLRTTYRAAVT